MRDKQIEEMARVMCQRQNSCYMCDVNSPCRCRTDALLLNAEGYRKASEIFEEIEKICNDYNRYEIGERGLFAKLAELKKKYTEGGE